MDNLAQTLVSCPWWRWLPGMILEGGGIICEVGRKDVLIMDDGEEIEPGKGSLPHLGMYVTRGAIEGLLRAQGVILQARLQSPDWTPGSSAQTGWRVFWWEKTMSGYRPHGGLWRLTWEEALADAIKVGSVPHE